MNQFKIAFIVLLLGVFSSGCYTTIYNSVEGDVYIENPPPPTRPPRPHPPYYPPQPIIIIPAPVEPAPPEYKTRPPENDGGNKKRNPGVIDPIRIGGGRGNDEGRR